MSMPSSVMVFGIVFLFFLYACVRLAESEIASHTLADLFRKLAERPLAEKLFVLVFVGMMVTHGGSKSTNSVPEGGGEGAAIVTTTVTGANDIVTAGTATNSVITGGAIAGGDVTGDFEEIGAGGFGMLAGLDTELPRLTTNQYLAGFALVSVSTHTAPWLTVPSNAVTHAPWVRYGVAEDTFWLPTNGWVFVLGTNEVDGAHISSSGTLSFGSPKGSPRAVEMPDGTNISFLAALQGSLGIVPPQGRFWHAPTPSNSLLCTWQDVCAGRDSNSVVSFQAELFWNGDFAYRYAFTGAPAFTNFVVGAQNRGGGETYALDAANLLANGLELHWRAFGMLDPGVEDHDGDGLSTYDEVMLYGTNPALRDTDHDGLEDADELAAGTNPRNPDSDGDGLADGIDPDPLVWDDPDGDAGNDGLGYLFEVIHGLDPAADNALDSDGDGWADWKELMAGTDPDDMSSVPVNIDGIQTQVPVLFEATVTLNASLPCDALLRVGDRTVVLRQARSYTLTLVEGVAYPVSVAASRPCTVSLSATLSSPYAAFQDPGGVFSGGAAVPGGAPVACGMIAQPAARILPERVCFHSGAPKTVAAKVSPPMAGSYRWDWYGGDISSVTGRSANISWDGGDSHVYLSFTASGAAQPRCGHREVTRCAKVDEDTWCDDHGCEHWYCACDNDDASGDDDCGFHGQKVSKCRESVCPTHGCPYDGCPDGWCHRHDTWYSDCDGWWCHMHDRPLSGCDHDPEEDPGGGGGSGGGADPGEPVFGSSDESLAAVNNDDDDASGAEDSGEAPVAGENDLAAIWPLGYFDGQCCPCPEHRVPPEGSQSAELESCSARLALHTDAIKTDAFGATVGAGQAVWVEGLSASPSVGADRVVWKWTDGDSHVHRVTNAFTVLSVRLFGDTDLDGDVDADDKALHPALSRETGWAMPAATNVFRPVRLRTDVGLSGGAYTLSLSGAGIRVWPDASGTNAPLLECGQTVTNGAGGGTFIAGTDTDLYVEAVSNGVATLTYAYTGTGAASNLACSAALKMTAIKPDIVLTGDYSYLPIRPVFDGTAGKKWVVATFPEPQQTNILWNVQLLGKDSGPARIKYQRGSDPEQEAPWEGASHNLAFVDGWLNASIRLNDGSGTAPSMTFDLGVVTISGVQQGDKIIVEETDLGGRDEIAVVKNFSFNDLQRLGTNNLAMHPDFYSLHSEIKSAIIETVLFCLDATSSRSQKAQLTNDIFRSSGLYAVEYTNFISLHPNLLVLDIPSARSIGRFPDDSDHFHLGLETASIPFGLASKRESLRNARDPAYDNGFGAFQDATVSLLVDLINSAYDYPSSISFLLFHTYEDTTTFAINYLASEASEYLRPGDPTRNLRWSFIADASPQLTYPGQENDADWMNGNDPPVDLCQIQFFVTRKGEIVLLGTDGYELVIQGLISDALEVQ